MLHSRRSYEIATKIAYRNGCRIGIPKGGNMDCTMVRAAPVLPAGYELHQRKSFTGSGDGAANGVGKV
jgi:hypothetical protein